jgi:hypothetical protein
MALLLNNPFGDIRGSSRALTFTANSSGNVLRFKKTQKSSNTVMQLSSKKLLSSVSSQWKNLSPQQRLDWSNFAQHIFISLVPNNSGKWTGYQAFLSCNISLLQSHAAYVYFEYYKLPDTILVLNYDLPFYIYYDCYAWQVDNNIWSDVGSIFSVKLSNVGGVMGNQSPTVYLHVDGLFGLKIYWNGIGASCLIQTQLHDGNFNLMFFKFYLSEKLKFSGQKPSNPYRYLIGSTGLTDFTPIGINGSAGLDLRVTSLPVVANGLLNLKVGSIYLFSLVETGSNGTMRLCDTFEITILSAIPP